jgi:hypothetical protein
MRRFIRLVILLGFLAADSGLLLQAQGTSGGDIAVVVNPDVPIENLSFEDVRRLVLGNKQYWPGNLRVTLLLRAPIARERDVVLRKVCDMNEAQFRQYWIGKVFRAEIASSPKIVYSNDMALNLLTSLPGSMAFMDSTAVPRNLKVVQIDGKLPGQQGYPLR